MCSKNKHHDCFQSGGPFCNICGNALTIVTEEERVRKNFCYVMDYESDQTADYHFLSNLDYVDSDCCGFDPKCDIFLIDGIDIDADDVQVIEQVNLKHKPPTKKFLNKLQKIMKYESVEVKYGIVVSHR